MLFITNFLLSKCFIVPQTLKCVHLLYSVQLIILHFLFPHRNSTLWINSIWIIHELSLQETIVFTCHNREIIQNRTVMRWHFALPMGNCCCVSRVGWRHDKMLNGEEKRGGGKTDQYCSGNKVEKVIYLTLIRCLGSRAGPASLLLTFKPECTHKR